MNTARPRRQNIRLNGQSDDIFRRVSIDGRVPLVNGEPVNARSIAWGQMVAVGPDRYQLTWPSNRGPVVAGGEDGQPWTFSLRALIRESGQ